MPPARYASCALWRLNDGIDLAPLRRRLQRRILLYQTKANLNLYLATDITRKMFCFLLTSCGDCSVNGVWVAIKDAKAAKPMGIQ